MGQPVVLVDSGGLPVTEATNGLGSPITPSDNGFGLSVTLVGSGGLPVVMDLLPPPQGFTYLLGADGAYLKGTDGAYLLGVAP